MISNDVWKLTVSVVSTTIAAVAVGIGVWQYLAEGERNRRAADQRNRQEFNRALWEEEFKTYRDISAAVGNLVAAVEMNNAEARMQAEKAFRALYWGRAVFVEDGSIETQMVTFRRRIIQYAEGRLTDDQFKKAAEDLSDALKDAARTGEGAAQVGTAPADTVP